MMNTTVLFAATVFIWGTSWLAIAWQIGEVPVLHSIFYRFALAAVLMFAALILFGRLKLPGIWRFVVLQAFCLFSLNFVAFYQATSLIPSGLVSVIFSLASIFNAVNARVFYGELITKRVVLAAVLGVSGLILIFWQSLVLSYDASTLIGVGWAMLGTLFFSFGNMASRKNSSLGISPVTANVWGMGIGAAFILTLIFLGGEPLQVPSAPFYYAALVYLAVFASVIGFSTYLLLVARIGAAQAGYATVLFPVVALSLSTFAEGFAWSFMAVIGVCFTLAGNYVMFSQPRQHSLKLLKEAG